jgi:hypothetical protein
MRVDTIRVRVYQMGIADAEIVERWGGGAYGVVVGASTAAAVDTAAPAARCMEGESGKRQRGALWVVRREEKERARGTREGGRKRRCHSCGRSQATVAAGFGIGVSGRRRREELRFWAFWGWDVLTAFVGLLLHRAQIR